MRTRRSHRLVPLGGIAWLVAVAALASACGGSDVPDTTEGASTGSSASGATATASAAAGTPGEGTSAFPFPTGPAVVVPAGYEPPGDIVDSTGAHLPANGKPTLVYVDAIW